MNILGISGSLRAGSYNTALLRAARQLAPEGMEIAITTLHAIPGYNADLHEEKIPDEVQLFHNSIQSSDGVLIATPEYNRSIPGVLKNAIDWVSKMSPQPFARRPVAITGASPGAIGTIMANYHLRQVLSVLDARMIAGPEYIVGRAGDVFDDGHLVDEKIRDGVSKLLSKLEYEVRLIGAG